MKKIVRKIMILLMINALLLVGCHKDATISKMEQFINVLIDNDTYKQTTEDKVKAVLCEYMTEEAFDDYKFNEFLYAYPTTYNKMHIKDIKISNIKCTQKEKDTYEFQVKYIMLLDKGKEEMTDHIRITKGEDGKYTEVILLNNSDIDQKYFFDVQVH